MSQALRGIHASLLLAIASLVAAGLALCGPAKAPASEGSHFHPLDAGRSWEYEVIEGEEVKQQHIEVQAGDSDDAWVLATRAGSRRAYYEISASSGCYYLHKIRYKLSFLPFGKSTSFEPPLPFLKTDASDSTSWSWAGQANGMGRTLRTADYCARVVRQAESDPAGALMMGDLIVDAVFVEDNGATHAQRAIYRPGVGLLRIESPQHHKQLIRWRRAGESGWQTMAPAKVAIVQGSVR